MIDVIADWLDAHVAMSQWLVGFGTLALALVAVLQDRIRAWIMHPNLDISFEPRDCLKTPATATGLCGKQVSTDSYYFRFRVRNSGNNRANLVEVFAKELSKQQVNGSFERLDCFSPMNLVWSYIKRPIYLGISPEMHRHCDLGHIIDPSMRPTIGDEDHPESDVQADETIFAFELEATPFNKTHLIGPGKYRLTLLITAANARKPKKKIVEIEHGHWCADEKRMLNENVRIRIL